MHVLALQFPPVSRTVHWKELFGTHGALAINKVVLEMWLAVIIVAALFFIAARRQALVPAGVQNVVESAIEFVQNGIILQTMGPEGMYWTPFLVTMFCFILVCNLFEVIPIIQMPVTARMAIPFLLAMAVWVFYNFVGFWKQGPSYIKNSLIPPGVPKAMLPLVALIEFVQLLFVRPFSLAVRLFANLLAGHLLLISFSVLTAALFASTFVGAVVPGALLVALYGFEVLVSVLQAFIFTILTAVYIGGSMHPEH